MTLHIYGQSHPHDESYIVGTKESLSNLASAIQRALEQGTGVADCEFTNDGERFIPVVLCLAEEDINTLDVPYSNGCYRANSTKHPTDILDLADKALILQAYEK